MKKRFLAVGLAFVMMFSLVGISGCANLSNEEHIERISARVQERFIDSAEYPYTDFTVTILYNTWAGEPQFFMVEFEPGGFMYGVIHRNNYYFRDRSFFRGFSWINEAGIERSGGLYFWCEIEQQRVLHFRSHFYFYEITAERKYLAILEKWGELSPLIRIGSYFYLVGSPKCDLGYFMEYFPVPNGVPSGSTNPISRANRGIRL